jgi:hypothetical protein
VGSPSSGLLCHRGALPPGATTWRCRLALNLPACDIDVQRGLQLISLPCPAPPACLPARLHARLQSSVKATYGYANDWGVFYGGKGYQLGVQALGVVVIAAWACSLSALMFLAMKKVGGLAGMPLCCHGWQEPR